MIGERGPATFPAHFEAEVWSAIARLTRRRQLVLSEARAAARDAAAFPGERVPLGPLLAAVPAWIGRASGADSFYAALADIAGAPLLTCDLRLARALDGRLPVLFVEPTVY